MNLITAASAHFSASGSLVGLVVIVLSIIGFWTLFAKAGRPGWAAIIPFYNVYTLCKVGGRPGGWWLLFLIPFVNIVMAFIVFHDVAKAFGKSTLFGVLMVFFSFICALIIGLGSATYTKPITARA